MYGMNLETLKTTLRNRVGFRQFSSTDQMVTEIADEILTLIAENNSHYDRVINNLVWQLNNNFGHLTQRVITLEKSLDDQDDQAK